MALLLAQPEHVTETWKPLAEAINRWLWRWSPWHLRLLLENFKRKTGERFMEFGPTLKWSYAEDPFWHESRRLQDPDFEKFMDREAANVMAQELLAKGAISKRIYKNEWRPEIIREYTIQVARAVHPC